MQNSQSNSESANGDLKSSDLDSARVLASIELGSIALGYRTLSALTALTANKESGDPYRILDASPVGAKFLILFSGTKNDVTKSLQELRSHVDGEESAKSQWLDSAVVEKNAQTIAEAAFALPQVEPGESMIVAECSSVSGLLTLAELFVSGHHLQVIEIRIARSSTGGAYGFFTGSQAHCAPAVETARTRLRASLRSGRVELIENPTAAFRAFFTLSGNH